MRAQYRKTPASVSILFNTSIVDEVGQFIGMDSHLMLNLQTITEELGTICGGRAWIVVTVRVQAGVSVRKTPWSAAIVARPFNKCASAETSAPGGCRGLRALVGSCISVRIGSSSGG